MNRTQVFHMELDPAPEVLLLILHPFAVAQLTPERIDVRYDRTSATPTLSVTAYFSNVDDIEALDLVRRLLKTPKVRTATVEALPARAG